MKSSSTHYIQTPNAQNQLKHIFILLAFDTFDLSSHKGTELLDQGSAGRAIHNSFSTPKSKVFIFSKLDFAIQMGFVFRDGAMKSPGVSRDTPQLSLRSASFIGFSIRIPFFLTVLSIGIPLIKIYDTFERKFSFRIPLIFCSRSATVRVDRLHVISS